MPRGRPCLGWEVLTGQSKTKKQDGLPAGGRPETDHGALGPGLGLADPTLVDEESSGGNGSGPGRSGRCPSPFTLSWLETPEADPETVRGRVILGGGLRLAAGGWG